MRVLPAGSDEAAQATAARIVRAKVRRGYRAGLEAPLHPPIFLNHPPHIHSPTHRSDAARWTSYYEGQ